MTFNQEACLALLAYSNEDFAALGMGALEPCSAVAHSPHQDIWDEHMGSHLNLAYGAICGGGSRRRCEGWKQLPTHVNIPREVNGADRG